MLRGIFYILKSVCDIVYHLFGLFPAEAWICDRFAVDMLVYFLLTVLDIALDHKAFYKLMYIAVIAAAAEDFLNYSRLLKRLLA